LSPPDPGGGTLQLQVRAIRLQAERTHAFELARPDGAPLPAVQAGAHVDVQLPGGLVRSYSLAGDPHDRSHWLLGVLREVQGGGGSRAMHERVRVGDLLSVGAPRNAFVLAPGASHTLLLGGGIGITPLKAMAHALAGQRQASERFVSLDGLWKFQWARSWGERAGREFVLPGKSQVYLLY
jgi:vanillate O-demethylase ferredoxin subunit